MAWTESSSEDRTSFSYDGPGRELVETTYGHSWLSSYVVFGTLLVLSVGLARFQLLLSFGGMVLSCAGMVWASRSSRIRTKRVTRDHFVVTLSSSGVVVTSIQGMNRVIALEHVMGFTGDGILRVLLRDGAQQILPPAGDDMDYAALADAMNLALRRIHSQRAGYRGHL